jgi:phosphoribosyl-ATP pyrophosphohydrolase
MDDLVNMDWKGYLSDQIESERLVRTTWGDKCFESLPERGTSVGEEGIETMQACGATREQAHALVDMVYDKPVGELRQEIAGVGFTLLALCANRGLRLDEVLAAELKRFKSKDPKHYRDKQKLKAALGVSIRAE